jgi:hypothetical protein
MKGKTEREKKMTPPVEDKEVLGKRKTEEKKEWNSLRTYTQFQKTAGTCL